MRRTFSIYSFAAWMVNLICVLVVTLTFSRFGLSQAKEPDPATVKLYKQHCQSCHMPKGNARAKLLNLADGIWKHGGTKKDIINVITNGVPPTAMKGFKEKLTPKQIDEMADYVLTFEKKVAEAKK